MKKLNITAEDILLHYEYLGQMGHELGQYVNSLDTYEDPADLIAMVKDLGIKLFEDTKRPLKVLAPHIARLLDTLPTCAVKTFIETRWEEAKRLGAEGKKTLEAFDALLIKEEPFCTALRCVNKQLQQHKFNN